MLWYFIFFKRLNLKVFILLSYFYFEWAKYIRNKENLQENKNKKERRK